VAGFINWPHLKQACIGALRVSRHLAQGHGVGGAGVTRGEAQVEAGGRRRPQVRQSAPGGPLKPVSVVTP
jgi:hypothetical protein